MQIARVLLLFKSRQLRGHVTPVDHFHTSIILQSEYEILDIVKAKSKIVDSCTVICDTFHNLFSPYEAEVNYYGRQT